MKKIRINGEFALFIALIILAIGLVFIIKANYGMTVVQAPVFVLSIAITSISLGTWNYIVQGGLFILMLLIIRRFRVNYLISFITGILYGFILDFFVWALQDLIANNIYMSILFYIIGFVSICIAVALFFSCKAPLMPYDIFIREVSKYKKINLTKFKWGFDISCIIIAIILSLTLTGKFIGIGIGTVIFALFVSPCMTFIMKFLNKFLEFKSIFQEKLKEAKIE